MKPVRTGARAGVGAGMLKGTAAVTATSESARRKVEGEGGNGLPPWS